MSTFVVEVRKIREIRAHSNADLLEIGEVEGLAYQFVVGKGLYKAGDEVVYFPIDSVLSQELVACLGTGKFMAGAEKNRFKTVRLRQEISQGYVAPTQIIKDFLKVETLPENLTEALGVVKYEPPEIVVKGANLLHLPENVSIYDIENVERHPNVVERLFQVPCFITEKAEGSHFSCTADPEAKVHVCQRKHEIECLPDFEEHTWWKVARKEGILDLVLEIQAKRFPGHTVTLRGEMLGHGVQGNYYGFSKHTIKLFEMEVDGRPVDADVFIESVGGMEAFEKIGVPVLFYNGMLNDFLNGKTIQEASNGYSKMNPTKLREGIVIKPMKEEYMHGFGRLFIKMRDPIYLDKTGN